MSLLLARPHHGRNLTAHHFGEALVAALNTIPGYGEVPAKLFIRGWGKDYFDLQDLNTPNILQHVASLTRDDTTPGNIHIEVSPERVAALLADSPTNFINAKSLAKSRVHVEKMSEPNAMSITQRPMAIVESGLLLMIMNEQPIHPFLSIPSSDFWSAPKDRVRVFLVEERLPAELGWKRSERQLGALDLLPVVKAVFDQKMILDAEGFLDSVKKFLGVEELVKAFGIGS